MQNRVREYMIVFLILETLMIGAFTTLDLAMFYVFFEGTPDPDVPDHRHLGRHAAHPGELQVLLLYLHRLGADAARHHGDVLAGRHARHLASCWPSTSIRRHAGLAVARLLRLVRGEDADVAVPSLAAGSARRGADRRLGDPGGDPAEVRRLRLHALLAADVPRCLAAVRARSSSCCRWRRSS